MNVEQFIARFCDVLYTTSGWEEPLTMERLHGLLQQTLNEHHAEIYK